MPRAPILAVASVDLIRWFTVVYSTVSRLNKHEIKSGRFVVGATYSALHAALLFLDYSVTHPRVLKGVHCR